jgi:TetR/AcrR family transcriptional regulator, transcriptional repressor for nem operon
MPVRKLYAPIYRNGILKRSETLAPWFRAMTGILERSLPDSAGRSHAKAQAIAALCVGGMVVARALDDRALADELREAAMTVALELGGWDTSAKARSKSARYRTA